MAWIYRSRQSRRRILSHFRQNPLLMRETRLFLRNWLQWLMIIAGVWVPVALLTRVFLYTLVGGVAMRLPTPLLIAMETLGLVLRPDVFLGFFVVYRMAAQEGWIEMREALALTFLSESQIIISKFIVPFVLLCAINMLAAPIYYYEYIVSDRYVIPLESIGIPHFSTGALIVPFAICEDIFFAALVVLVSMNAFLFRRNVLLETFKALGVISIVGVFASLASFSVLLIPVQWYVRFGRTWASTHLLENGVFFLLVFPIQWMMILFFWKRVNKRLSTWLRE